MRTAPALRDPEPFVILLDVQLPRYDGMAVLRAIRKAPALEHIQVVVVSGLVNPRQEAVIATYKAFYRRKPSTLNELAELAEEIFVIFKGHSNWAPLLHQ